MTDVTRILNAIEGGDKQAADQLLPLVYEELRLLAARKLSDERPGQTLQATALVHEAYLRLVGPDPDAIRDSGPDRKWTGRNHFFMAAAEAMRRILIESARRKKSLKYGGTHKRVDLDYAAVLTRETPDELMALDEELERLAAEDPTKADLVKLRYFAGLSIDQAAEVLGISRATAIRHWSFARAWLFQRIKKDA
ncbi:MAG: sigma-70 family RNA polymerase sigma factor [Sedimentisphaerales bacterium]|jgi:RNA polymerase sigma factor (TIGR02999 family)